MLISSDNNSETMFFFFLTRSFLHLCFSPLRYTLVTAYPCTPGEVVHGHSRLCFPSCQSLIEQSNCAELGCSLERVSGILVVLLYHLKCDCVCVCLFSLVQDGFCPADQILLRFQHWHLSSTTLYRHVMVGSFFFPLLLSGLLESFAVSSVFFFPYCINI